MLSEWETNPPKRHPERIRVEISWLSKLAGPSESGQNKKKILQFQLQTRETIFYVFFLALYTAFMCFPSTYSICHSLHTSEDELNPLSRSPSLRPPALNTPMANGAFHFSFRNSWTDY